jgi:exodeoxyribonuclease VII large subunit
VAQINRAARDLLERELGLVEIEAELATLTRAASGHWYMTLKDAEAQVRAVMFRQRVRWLDWNPRDGERVVVHARLTVYEPRGELQVAVEAMRRAGVGDLFAAFLRLRERLQGEGLFAPERKRPLPSFPAAVGVISSLQGAALRDVLVTLAERAPHVRVVIYPSAVQGPAAAGELRRALQNANSRREVDLLILCRGGGAIEDLVAFNDEGLARAVAESMLPVVSGVGHETDFTIVDFVADVRAATPTAAALAAVPETLALRQRCAHRADQLARLTQRRMADLGQRLDWLSARLLPPAAHLRMARVRLAGLADRLRRGALDALGAAQRRAETGARRLASRRPDVPEAKAHLHARWRALAKAQSAMLLARRERLRYASEMLRNLSCERTLQRGFCIVRDGRGALVTNPTGLHPGMPLTLQWAHGEILAQVVRPVT